MIKAILAELAAAVLVIVCAYLAVSLMGAVQK